MTKLLSFLSILFLVSTSFAVDDFDAPFLFEEVDASQNLGQKSFTKAKNFLKNDIYPSHQEGIYCGCTYDKQVVVKDYQEEKLKALTRYKLFHWDSEEGFQYPTEEEFNNKKPTYKLVPNPETCGFEPKGNGTRAKQMEWEHVVPASFFGHTFSEWENGHDTCISTPRQVRKCKRLNAVELRSVASEPKCTTDPATGVQTCVSKDIVCETYMSDPKPYSGRRCLTKVSEEYSLMQADMHNLYPAIGDVNGYRSNFPMAEIAGEAREFGKCDAEIKDKKFEPRNEVRGDIARTHFYMQDAYKAHMPISDEMYEMLKRWNDLDPVDTWECDRNKKIAELQGNENEFVSKPCEKLLKRNAKRKGIFQVLFDLFK
ncbi:MAG: endonuclease [Candidatus Cloacimonetes bacterium]|nr:endonuclease [Candidatus Cloacimonadota bacterium]